MLRDLMTISSWKAGQCDICIKFISFNERPLSIAFQSVSRYIFCHECIKALHVFFHSLWGKLHLFATLFSLAPVSCIWSTDYGVLWSQELALSKGLHRIRSMLLLGLHWRHCTWPLVWPLCEMKATLYNHWWHLIYSVVRAVLLRWIILVCQGVWTVV